VFNIADMQNLDLDKFGIFGKSYNLLNSRPTLIELCRFCMSDEKYSKQLLRAFQNNSSEYDFKQFKRKYYATSSMKILQNFWHEINLEENSNPEQMMYHSGRRKWLTIVENTNLRDYQTECLEIIKTNFDSKKSTLLILPTGAGKTRTVVQSIREIIDSSIKPLHILWIVHTSPLCLQAENAIQNSWVEPRQDTNHKHIWLNSVYGSGIKMTKAMFGDNPSFTISTPDSIERGNWDSGLEQVFDIIVCDEAHHGVFEQDRIVEKWPNAHRIGITATPALASKNSIFNKLYSTACWPKAFIKNNGGNDWKDTKDILIIGGFLSDYGGIAEKFIEHEADLLGLDFKRKSKWTEQPSSVIVANKLAQKMLEEGCNRILLFVNEVEQARAITGFLRDHQINASAVYGTLSQDERNSRINGFSSGHFQVLVSVNILREGIDVPLVDGILIMRRSLIQDDPMFTQILGRGLRGPKSGGTEKCLVWHVV
jgi:superfamily II DNA or RNA helicase